MTKDLKPVHGQPLTGLNILVTRPEAQAHKLCDMIVAHGGHPIKFPTLEIAPIKDRKTVLRIFENLVDYNWLFFISANAVDYANAICDGNLRIPLQLKVAAVGKATANVLENNKIKVDLIPKEQFNSEALLASPEMQEVTGQNILIVRGHGGRKFLATVLRERGANVEYVEVYRRVQPSADIRPIIALWRRDGIDAVTVSSGEILQNLVAMLDTEGQDLLKDTPIVVPSHRIMQDAKTIGLEKVILAADATNWALLDATIKNCENIRR